jgi:protocatechuate 3,4-dioxygenase beta subunit
MAGAQDPLNDPIYAGKEKKGDQLRTLNGNVRDKNESPLPGAIVYLKNMKTLGVKTYIADNEGAFHFHSLSPNVDFEIYGEFNGQRSATKMLSSFDSRPVVNMELKIDAKK